MHINHPNRKWLLTIATGIMIFLANADFTIANLAIEPMAQIFNAKLSNLQWVITSYLLAAFIFFIMGGRFADIFGKRRIFLLGTVLFSIGCFGAALAQNLIFLDAMRFLQGIGFSFTLGLAILLNSEAFPKHQQGFSVGISITITGTAQAIGPILGGFILQYTNWRWLFGYAVPLSLLSLIMTFKYCHQDKTNHHSTDSFIRGIFNKHIWFNKPFLMVTTIRVFFMFSWAVVLFTMPLYLQNKFILSPFNTGLMLMIMTVMIGMLSPLTGYFMDKIGYRWPIITATILLILSFTSLININSDTALTHVGLMLFLFGLSSGIMIPASVRGAMHSLPDANKGTGMGLFFTGNFLFSIIGISITTHMFNHAIKNFFSLHIYRHVIFMNLALGIVSICICLLWLAQDFKNGFKY